MLNLKFENYSSSSSLYRKRVFLKNSSNEFIEIVYQFKESKNLIFWQQAWRQPMSLDFAKISDKKIKYLINEKYDARHLYESTKSLL